MNTFKEIKNEVKIKEVDLITFINIGFGNVVDSSRIIAMVNPNTSPSKKMIKNAKKERRLVDATYGRPSRGAILIDTNHIVISPINTDTLAERIEED